MSASSPVLTMHDELRTHTRDFLALHADVSATLRLVESDPSFDAVVWRRMSTDAELPGIAIGEEFGGQGFGFAEQCVVVEELGRVLYSGPYLCSAVLAAGFLARSKDGDLKKKWLPGIANGEIVMTVAVSESSLMWSASNPSTTATKIAEDSFEIRGKKSAVIAGRDADAYLVVANDADGRGPVVVVVERNAGGVTVSPRASLDLTRPMATVEFDGAIGQQVEYADTAVELRYLFDLACGAIAAEQVGAASAVLDLTLEYARQRVQFGREIGSFQAVRHRLADLYSGVETAAAAMRRAVYAIATETDDRTVASATARAVATDTFKEVAAAAIQLHGGTGFTWEHPAHLYFKRAKASELLLGNASAHRRRIHRELHGW